MDAGCGISTRCGMRGWDAGCGKGRMRDAGWDAGLRERPDAGCEVRCSSHDIRQIASRAAFHSWRGLFPHPASHTPHPASGRIPHPGSHPASRILPFPHPASQPRIPHRVEIPHPASHPASRILPFPHPASQPRIPHRVEIPHPASISPAAVHLACRGVRLAAYSQPLASHAPLPTRTSMRRLLILPAALAFATVALAQDPGVSVLPFDQKHAGSDKMQMLSHVVSHPGAWKAADIEIEQDPRPAVRLRLRLRQLRRADLRHQQHRQRRRRSTTGPSRTPSCTAASARWTASTSRSATATTTRSRTSSCRAVPTRISAR